MMFRKPWFWYSVLAVLAWGAWAVLSKLAASEIPAESLQFLFTIGILALFAAFRSGGNTGVITVTSSLYPVITVALALLILRERLTRIQTLGLALAAAAIVIFSL